MARRTDGEKGLLLQAMGIQATFWSNFSKAYVDAGGSNKELYALAALPLNEWDGPMASFSARVGREFAELVGIINGSEFTIEVTEKDLNYKLDPCVTAPGWREVDGPGYYGLTLEPFFFLSESRIEGETMMKRAVAGELDGATLAQAYALVREQHKIPVHFRGDIFIFTEALVLDEKERLCVHVVDWSGACWVLYRYPLEFAYKTNDHIVRARKIV